MSVSLRLTVNSQLVRYRLYSYLQQCSQARLADTPGEVQKAKVKEGKSTISIYLSLTSHTYPLSELVCSAFRDSNNFNAKFFEA